jgi:molecular chaperone GrpE
VPKPKKTDASHQDKQINELTARVEELTQALQRERADAVNLRRRHDAETAALRTRVKTDVIQDLLPVIDNFERALKHVPQELAGNSYVKGVEAVVKQFERTLADMGVKKIETVGQPFDPHLHEAVSVEGGDGKQQIVSEELQAGYRLGDDVIRHAMVKVRG